ncbi:ABC transporter permease [Rhodanobacter sp. DHG33]|uniref:ABC transporter permease n=1 Tax=Rhodanobacter sp. DHG33 TaxID=2775921 RepID=UPI001781CA6C|nr:ABC transporter permease [Rhodanobacter sp. DHG33]MBD8897564.1 ABC transporter permease [Rhodanobacter sp. DHG33]
MNIWLAEIWQAWRASLRRPGFLLLASGVLALGIGASVAVFALIDQVLLKPLPYPQPAQLANVGRDTTDRQISPLQYQQLPTLPGIASVGLLEASLTPANVTSDGQPEQVEALDVDRGLLPTLGVRLALGRNFDAGEDSPHGSKAVILSYGFWQHRYGGDVNVVGRSLPLEGSSYTIVGVLPASFDLLGGPDLLLPAALPAQSRDDGTNYLAVVRMSPGTSLGMLSAEFATRVHAMYAAIGGKQGEAGVHTQYNAVELRSGLRGESGRVLSMFMVSALFVLLIALVNLVNLMVLRALARAHDAAVRAALGAPTMRLAWPALAEGVLVGLVGAVAGMGLAGLGLHALHGFMPAEWQADAVHATGWLPWIVALAIGLTGALLSAVLGLWRGRAATTVDELREGGRNGIGQHSGLLGKTLVVAQVTLATTLLCGAGLFLHALRDAARTPLGFSTQGVLTFELAPIKTAYPDVPSVQQLTQRVLDRLRAEPGVADVAATTNLPIGDQLNMPVRAPGGQADAVQFRGVSPGYFAAFDIPLRSGRGFERSDGAGSEAVAVVNEAYARTYLGGKALGKTLEVVFGTTGNPTVRVVGVVADTRQFGPLQSAPAIVYVPLAQVPDTVMGLIRDFIPLRFALRTHGNPGDYRNAVHTILAEIAPQQPIANLRNLADIARGTTEPVRLDLLLVGLFALMALLLAAAGMYAVMAVAVAARRREFGVRLALGAAPLQLGRLVMRTGLLQVSMGLLLGVGVGWLLTDWLRGVVASVAEIRFEPLIVAWVCVTLAAAGLIACLLPALRATRVVPMQALRGE